MLRDVQRYLMYTDIESLDTWLFTWHTRFDTKFVRIVVIDPASQNVQKSNLYESQIFPFGPQSDYILALIYHLLYYKMKLSVFQSFCLSVCLYLPKYLEK